jgi:hypothetical protein
MKVGLTLHKKIQGSSVAEHSVVNRLAVGSNPTPGANPSLPAGDEMCPIRGNCRKTLRPVRTVYDSALNASKKFDHCVILEVTAK